jgi:transcriptional regulator of acetoin/glycerol metabolism
VAINTGPMLYLHDLPSPIQNSIHARRAHSMVAAAAAVGPVAMMKPPARAEYPDRPVSTDVPILPLIEMERRAILRALEYTNGDRGVAAHLLGIGRTTLYRKLKEYQMAV